MTENRMQALAVLGGIALFFAIASLFITPLNVDLIYRCVLIAVILGATFLLGIILSLPGVRHLFEATIKWIKRHKKKLCVVIVLSLVSLVAWLFYIERVYHFVYQHRYEFFWLVFFPGMFILPYLYAVLASSLRSNKNSL